MSVLWERRGNETERCATEPAPLYFWPARWRDRHPHAYAGIVFGLALLGTLALCVAGILWLGGF
jgi:hypothetical protein